MSVRPDPELDELFEDGDTREFAQLLQRLPHPSANVDPSPQFRLALRRHLMEEAWRRASAPPPPWYRRLLAPQPMAWAGAAVGVLLIAVALLSFFTTPKATNRTVVITSPENDAQEVAVVQPIELMFNQPMDHASVERAVQIEPATKVQYQWQGDQAVKILPVNNLAPNTQYAVTVKTSAKTRSQQTLPQPAVVRFTTVAPPPTPAPTRSAPPTSTPSPLIERQVAPVGAVPSRWSADGGSIYVVSPTGQLQAWPAAGGPGRTLVPDGVTAFAVGPDGIAYARGGQIVYNSVTVNNVQPIAIGFRQGIVVFATTTDVETATGTRIATLSEAPTAVDFADAGDRMVYRGASGLHLVDLASGKDSVIGPSNGMGDWSPDGHRYAYPAGDGVYATDGVSPPARILSVQGITGLAWSPRNQLLMAGSSSLLLANADGSSLHRLAEGSFGQLSWSPGGTGVFAFRRADSQWIARLVGAIQGGSGNGAGVSQDDLVNSFIDARKAQKTDVLSSLADASGKDALSKLNLLVPDSPGAARATVLLSQPGRVIVRLVITRGTSQVAADDTLVIQKDASGRPWIHGLSENTRSPFGSGPEVRQVVVGGGQVQVFFDSDLIPSGSVSGVSIRGVQTQSGYDTKQRMVTLTVVGGLNPGATYTLDVGSSLQDVNQRQAMPYQLVFVGPSS